MPKHSWSVICARTVVDQKTNQVSLFDVQEAIEVYSEPPEGDELINTDHSIELVVAMIRDEPDVPERAKIRVRLELEELKDQELNMVFDIDLLELGKSRHIIQLSPMPVTKQGFQWVNVDCECSGEWVNWARLPLEVKYFPPKG